MTNKNNEREQRIIMEIIVDAYDEIERSLGWYYYLQDHLEFPFAATCVNERIISPLQIRDEVDVLEMAPECECENEIFVVIREGRKGLAVPLSQLKPIADTDETTIQAVEDWHYWVKQGYRF